MLSQEKGISKYRSNLWERYVNGNLFSISPPFPLSNAVEENKKRRDAMQVLFRISDKIERKKEKTDQNEKQGTDFKDPPP